MERDKTYKSLNLWASRAEDQGAWLFGVTLDGADVVIAAKKLGGVDSDIAAAKATPPSDSTSPTQPTS